MGICSRHQKYEPMCELCNSSVEDLLPNWKQVKEEAEKAGLTVCKGCKFVYYRTVDSCPKCYTKRIEI